MPQIRQRRLIRLITKMLALVEAAATVTRNHRRRIADIVVDRDSAAVGDERVVENRTIVGVFHRLQLINEVSHQFELLLIAGERGFVGFAAFAGVRRLVAVDLETQLRKQAGRRLTISDHAGHVGLNRRGHQVVG